MPLFARLTHMIPGKWDTEIYRWSVHAARNRMTYGREFKKI